MLNRRARAGFTLPELLIAMATAGVLFAVVSASALRQQRLFAEATESAAMTGRLREAVATLPIDLRGVSPMAGDIREARDTALEVRATIASAVVCDTTGHSLVLAPSDPGAATYAAYLTAVAPGDTAWLLTTPDSLEIWVPHRVTSVSSTPVTKCATGGPIGRRAPSSATTIVLDTSSRGPAPGAVVRVTRPVRYSLYRSADGTWQLGERDWNSGTSRLNAIQPVAGPFMSPSARGLSFKYVDTTGATVAAPVSATAGIALVRVGLRVQSANTVRVLGAAGVTRRIDSLESAVFLRNRR